MAGRRMTCPEQIVIEALARNTNLRGVKGMLQPVRYTNLTQNGIGGYGCLS